MGAEGTGLFMVRLRLDQGRLAELARRRRLPTREVDNGYVVHCALGELFGEQAPAPFAVTDDRGRTVTVLGYTQADAGTLRERADAFADPAVHAAVDWEGLAAKPMPAAWSAGRRVGFEVRACPVVRTSGETDRHRAGAEVDAFLAACWQAGEGVPVDRAVVYRGWLEGQFTRRGGARLLDVALQRFQREGLTRRTQGEDRKTRVVERPDATLTGTLEVTDDAGFRALLGRGVGRHRAFGFGMLLLRPAG